MAASRKDIRPGDPAPWFRQRSSSNPVFRFDTAAGRVLVLGLFGSAATPHAQAGLAALHARTDLFDDVCAAFFGVTMDPADEAGRVQPRLPGYRWFWDMDGTIGKLLGALATDFVPGKGNPEIAPRWVVLDSALRVIEVIPFASDQSDIARLLRVVEVHGTPAAAPQPHRPVPVLLLERVLEPELCSELLAYFAANEAHSSGFMVEEDGQTVLKQDTARKRRRDCTIEDNTLREKVRMRIVRRIVPELARAFQFHASRIERYLIGHYSGADAGFFQPHRDNTTKGTAHRRFAITLALDEDYEGGELNFPEYGRSLWKPPTGAAIVFSCSLLHRVEPMRRGERHVCVPFLYDEAAAKLREQNRKFLKL